MEFKTYQSPQDFSSFKIPDLSLPALDTFTYRSDLFVEENGVKKPRELTPEEKIQLSIKQAQPGVDLSQPLYNFSHDQSKFYQNEDIVYNPYMDMEDIYSKVDPFTWGDAADKAWKTFKINALASWVNLGHGLKGAIKGDLTEFYDNPYVEHIADLTEQLEQLKPQYKTEDQRENPLAFRNWGSSLKSVVPAFGTVGAGVFDMVLGHVGATVIGGAAGAVSGGGVGAVPGAVGGNIVQLGRDLNILKHTIQGAYNLAKVVNTGRTVGLANATMNSIRAMATTNNIKNAAQLVGTSMIFSNSEAALQAELNSRAIEQDLKDEYFKANGRYATGEDLERIQDTANKARNWTYGLNLALLSASNAKQFGSLMRGKVTPAVIDDLPVNFMVKDGAVRAVQGSTAKHIAKNILGNMATEGLEEWSQSLIDDVVGGYYKDTYHGQADFIDQLGESMVNQITDQNSWLEFIGGSLIGGVTSIRQGLAYNRIKQQTEQFVKDFNSSTNQLFDSSVRSANFETELVDAIKKGDKFRIKDLIDLEMYNFADLGVKRGAEEAQLDLFKSMETMDNNEFNAYYGLNLTPDQQLFYAKQLQSEFKQAASIVQRIDNAYKKNPYLERGFFRERAKSIEKALGLDPQQAQKLGIKVWEHFKGIYGRALYSYQAKEARVNELKRTSPVDDSLLTTNSEQAVKNWLKRTNQEIKAGIDRWSGLYGLVKDLSDNKNYVEAHNSIIQEGYTLSNLEWDNITEILQTEGAMKPLGEFLAKAQTTKGQVEILKENFDFIEHNERVVEEDTEVETETVTPRTPEENITRDTQEVSEPVTTSAIEIADKIQQGIPLTQEESNRYANDREFIDSLVDRREQRKQEEELSFTSRVDNMKDKDKLYPDKKFFEYNGKIGTHLQRVGRKLYLVNGKTKTEVTDPSKIIEKDKKTVPQAMEESPAEVKNVREQTVAETNLEKFITQNPKISEQGVEYIKTLTNSNIIEIIC